MSELVTAEQRQVLHQNWHQDRDHMPVVKIFSPAGSATWLLTAMNPVDNDTMLGLCDLGLGFPEVGYVSLAELESVEVSAIPGSAIKLKLERDLYFEAKHTLSVYTEAAYRRGHITSDDRALTEALAAIAARSKAA